MGATEHNIQFFKCSEPIKTPFCWNCKGLCTFRGKRENQRNLIICNADTATIGYKNREFPHITLVAVKKHSNTRTCTGRHPMADSSLGDPARTAHPGWLWTNAYVLTQRTTSAANVMRLVGLQPHMCMFTTHGVWLCTIQHVWKANRLHICTPVVQRVQHREDLLCRSYTDHPSDFYPKGPRQE